MTPLSRITPIRQLSRLYGALLGIDANLGRIAAAQAPLPEPGPTGTTVYERLGWRLLLEPSSLVDDSLIRFGSWEGPQIQQLAELVGAMRRDEPTTFLDVGSYWGLYAMTAARAGWADEVIAIEADRHNFAQLQANLFLNDFAARIECHNIAVSDAIGELQFLDSRAHPLGNRAGIHVVDATEPHGITTQRTTVDALTERAGHFVIAKIDVEGHELAVLRGMEQTIASNRVLIQIEVFEEQQAAVFGELERQGLRRIAERFPDYWFTNDEGAQHMSEHAS